MYGICVIPIYRHNDKQIVTQASKSIIQILTQRIGICWYRNAESKWFPKLQVQVRKQCQPYYLISSRVVSYRILSCHIIFYEIKSDHVSIELIPVWSFFQILLSCVWNRHEGRTEHLPASPSRPDLLRCWLWWLLMRAWRLGGAIPAIQKTETFYGPMATSSFSFPWNNASFRLQHSSMDKWIVRANSQPPKPYPNLLFHFSRHLWLLWKDWIG